MAPEDEKRGRGRPPIEIDLAELEQLCELGCTNRELANYYSVSERFIELRRRRPEFREAMDRGEARANISLRRTQMKLALKGDRTMLVWLGKQRLGQSEKVAAEHSGRVDGTPPPVIHVNFVSPPGEEEAD